MNSVDPQAVILKTAVSAVVVDDADFHTAPVDTEEIMLEAALSVRSFGFYENVGPRRSASPLPARSHLAPVATLPGVVRYDLRLAWVSALALTTFAAAAGFSAWLILVSEVAW